MIFSSLQKKKSAVSHTETSYLPDTLLLIYKL